MESSESDAILNLESTTPADADRPPAFPSSPDVDHARERLASAIANIAATRPRELRSTPSHDQAAERVVTSPGSAEDPSAVRLELRTTVAALARSLRAAGLPPERMLTLVKLEVTEADPDILREPMGRLLMSDVVRWSIEAFYSA
jgi:hypothetical protein